MKRTPIIILLFATAMLIGCTKKAPNTLENEAIELFGKSVKMIKTYTDSLRQAKDSATVERLNKDLEDGLMHLNFEYPADTYLEFSEGANDTISLMTRKFVVMRDSLLYKLAHPGAMADTVAQDSLAGKADNVHLTPGTVKVKSK